MILTALVTLSWVAYKATCLKPHDIKNNSSCSAAILVEKSTSHQNVAVIAMDSLLVCVACRI